MRRNIGGCFRYGNCRPAACRPRERPRFQHENRGLHKGPTGGPFDIRQRVRASPVPRLVSCLAIAEPGAAQLGWRQGATEMEWLVFFGGARSAYCCAGNRGRTLPYVSFANPNVLSIVSDFGRWLCGHRARIGCGGLCPPDRSARLVNAGRHLPRRRDNNEAGSERRRSEKGVARRWG
jgi:hypothetical protein